MQKTFFNHPLSFSTVDHLTCLHPILRNKGAEIAPLFAGLIIPLTQIKMVA